MEFLKDIVQEGDKVTEFEEACWYEFVTYPSEFLKYIDERHCQNFTDSELVEAGSA